MYLVRQRANIEETASNKISNFQKKVEKCAKKDDLNNYQKKQGSQEREIDVNNFSSPVSIFASISSLALVTSAFSPATASSCKPQHFLN